MEIQFYEKPGCINNAKQKKMLDQNGHSIFSQSLLSTPWTAERLRPFFGNMPVIEWFNPAAPRIKSGDVKPERHSEETALAAMIADPLLIRRPLIDAEGELACGFDNELVSKLLNNADVSAVQTCPKSDNKCD